MAIARNRGEGVTGAGAIVVPDGDHHIFRHTSLFMSEEKMPQKEWVLCHPLSQLPYPMNDSGRRHLREAHFHYAYERGAAESASAGLFMKMEGKEAWK